ncbi:MAG: DUF1343 domain-containing protein [Clostridia bacterium]|nr:DUF1343 domain-containing protein [Clostridia bacterium]
MIRTGLDNLSTVKGILKGARLGLMTNPTGVDASMRSSIDILNEGFRLSALLDCEHGVRGSVPAGEHIGSFRDEKTGVTVYSCYGASTHLSQVMLDDFDVFVYDIQDAGARFYTFIYSLSDAMEDCARAGKTVVVLDRPNPLGGLTVQGTLLDEEVSSFVGRYAIPTRYGLTVGEYARWVKSYLKLELDLHVVPMTGWKRSMRFEDTGLKFVPPSPNLSTLHAARVYPGTCIFEGCNISEGRGTALPFELIGAPFLDAEKLALRMNSLGLEGFYFREAYFTPACSKHAGQQCAGVQIYVTDELKADAPLMGLMLMDEIRAMSGDKFEWTSSIDRLVGTKDYREGRASGIELIEQNRLPIQDWQRQSEEFWLYT